MDVQLNRKSWHTSLYYWTFDKYPNYWSLCPYFWTIVTLIVVSPIIFVYKILSRLTNVIFQFFKTPEKSTSSNVISNKKKKTKAKLPQTKPSKLTKFFEWGTQRVGKWFLILLGIGVVIAIVSKFLKLVSVLGFWTAIKYLLIKLGGILLFLALIIGIIVSIGWSITRFLDSTTWLAIKAMWRSGFDKVCPGINWNDNK